ASKYIGSTIESVLNQTYSDFEFIIINDGSTDSTPDIINKYSQIDSRIKIINQSNQGMGFALNKGLGISRYPFIARIDADDIMGKNRLERQYNFLRTNQEYTLVGTFVRYINENGKIIGSGKSELTDWPKIKKRLIDNELIGLHHPSVMFKKDAVLKVGGYRGEFWPADDIDLLNRLLENNYKLLVIPEYLTDYRINSGSVSISKSLEANKKKRFVKYCMLNRRKGEREPTWLEFIEIDRNRPFIEKLNIYRKDYAVFFKKKAVYHFANKKYLNVIIHFFIFSLLSPFNSFTFWGNRKIV
ncbi:MAG: glycosyltransferase family 2 protein, partial [Ignavibacteria bacterium]|nr:glycosyltransferase family 2 protein [Ignavibacteria bacterium]